MLNMLETISAFNALNDAQRAELFDTLENEVKAEAYIMYAEKTLAKNPNDELGKIATVLAQYRMKNPRFKWDMRKFENASNSVVPLIESLRKNDDTCTVDAEIDVLTGTALHVTIGALSEIAFREDERNLLLKAIEEADIVSVGADKAEFTYISFVYKDVLRV